MLIPVKAKFKEDEILIEGKIDRSTDVDDV